MIEKLGAMIDCSRNAVPTVETLERLVDLLSEMGYNRIELYTEDVYEIEGRPFFGYLRGRYSGEEIRRLDAYAATRGVELTPCIQILAHLNQIFRWPAFDDVHDCNDILLADEPKTYELIEDMFRTAAQNFTSRNVNIGCDEAHMVGLGKYLDRHGYQNRFEIINRHLEKVLAIAKKYGFHCAMWSDMYFRLAFGEYYSDGKQLPPEVCEKIPKDITLIYWDYYSTDPKHYRAMLDSHKKIGNPVSFAGGAWKWSGFAPDNRYSLRIARAAVPELLRADIRDVLVTCWGDNGAETSHFACLPGLFLFARLALGKSTAREDMERDFRRITGTGFSEFMDADLLKGGFDDEDSYNGSAEKALLYNDFFCGLYDNWGENRAEYYRDTAQKLKNGQYGEFSYLFDTLRALAEVLERKADIGVRTRRLYRAGDRAGLRKIADEYEEIVRRVEHFHQVFSAQWMRENKPHGFDVQDIRLGGLMQRGRSCRERLLRYAAGELASIPELEEDLLPLADPKKPLNMNSYTLIATVNPL